MPQGSDEKKISSGVAWCWIELISTVSPVLKYVPSWMPGASFKCQAHEWHCLSCEMIDSPFKIVKQNTVRWAVLYTYIPILMRLQDPGQRCSSIMYHNSVQNTKTASLPGLPLRVLGLAKYFQPGKWVFPPKSPILIFSGWWLCRSQILTGSEVFKHCLMGFCYVGDLDTV